ncbi:DUF6188 family protein, partial [Streptomyces sp. NPDC058874]
MSTEVEPVEHEDRWILNLRGLSVVRISIDFRLTLVLDAGWEVVLEAPARLSTGPLHTNPGLPLTPERTLSPFLVAASSGLGEEALAGEASEAAAGD